MTYQTAIVHNTVWNHTSDRRGCAGVQFGKMIGRYVKAMIDQEVRIWRVRRTVKALNRLEDRVLADIGVERLEIQNVAETAVTKRSQGDMNGEWLRNDEMILEMLTT